MFGRLQNHDAAKTEGQGKVVGRELSCYCCLDGETEEIPLIKSNSNASSKVTLVTGALLPSCPSVFTEGIVLFDVSWMLLSATEQSHPDPPPYAWQSQTPVSSSLWYTGYLLSAIRQVMIVIAIRCKNLVVPHYHWLRCSSFES